LASQATEAAEAAQSGDAATQGTQACRPRPSAGQAASLCAKGVKSTGSKRLSAAGLTQWACPEGSKGIGGARDPQPGSIGQAGTADGRPKTAGGAEQRALPERAGPEVTKPACAQLRAKARGAKADTAAKAATQTTAKAAPQTTTEAAAQTATEAAAQTTAKAAAQTTTKAGLPKTRPAGLAHLPESCIRPD
jgi:hypothetical protein